MNIHPTAVIAKTAEIDSTAEIGPYAVIEDNVKIGANTIVKAHAVVSGPSMIGENNTIYSYATVGGAPQDISYKGEPTELFMGNNNEVREYATIHRGTVGGGGKTVIGNNVLLMAYTHVAHDCQIGNNVIMANVATLAGHVEIDDYATVGGLVAVHQFCRIGRYSYIGGMSGISRDVPPYMLLAGIRNQAKLSGINKIGLRRAKFSKESIKQLESAFRIIFRTEELLKKDAFARVKEEFPESREVQHLVAFLESSQRGFIQRASDDD